MFSQDSGCSLQRFNCTRSTVLELKVDHNLNPINLIPFALQWPVEEELNKFVKQGVREPVHSSQWGSSIVQK